MGICYSNNFETSLGVIGFQKHFNESSKPPVASSLTPEAKATLSTRAAPELGRHEFEEITIGLEGGRVQRKK